MRKRFGLNNQSNLEQLISLYNKWVPGYFTPVEFSYLLTDNWARCYYVRLAELLSQKIITIRSDNRFLYYPKNKCEDPAFYIMAHCAVAAPATLVDVKENPDVFKIQISYLETFLKTQRSSEPLHKLVAQPILKARELQSLNELKSDVRQIRNIANTMCKSGTLPFVDFFSIVRDYANISPALAYYCFQVDQLPISPDECDKDVFTIKVERNPEFDSIWNSWGVVYGDSGLFSISAGIWGLGGFDGFGGFLD